MKKIVRCVHLTRSEVDYLKTVALFPLPLLEFLKDVRWRPELSEGSFEVSPATAEEFREALTEQLAKVGFDKSYEPTAEGKLLEDLIDRFQEGS